MVVLMDRADYITEALRQLQDPIYYTPLAEPIYLETAKQIGELRALHAPNMITKRQLNYLMGKSPPRPRYFYLLPKIHKPQHKWTIPHRIPPGRPIISDWGSERYGVAEYLDHFLTPLSIKHGSYIKDTQHFLQKMRTLTLEEPCFLFTMNVNSLYTNIETPLGIESVKKNWHDSRLQPDQTKQSYVSWKSA